MSEHETTTPPPPANTIIWLLVDHSARAEACAAVADQLRARDLQVQIVTISEVIGTMARDAITGSAERLLRGLRVAVQGRPSDEDLLGAVHRVRPDVLAITNARHVRALSLLESLTGIPSLQVGVVSDYNLDEQWARSGLHAFIVPHQELSDKLARAGVPKDRVLVAGPAIQTSFTKSLDPSAIRAELGFSQSETLVLVRAETFELATLDKLVFQCKLVEGNVRFIFHHQGDSAAANALRRAAAEYGLPAIMFGRVPDLERYVAAADLAIVAPLEPLMPELIAQGCPVYMIGPDDGAAHQVDFLRRHGLGEHTRDLLRLGAELDRFLRPERLDAARAAAREIGLPDGSAQVADALATAAAHAIAWRSAPPFDPGQGGQGGQDKPPAQEQPPAGGPFEVIGGPASNASGAPQGGAGGAGGARREVDDYAGISQAEAKEQMAQLILQERELERRLAELEKEQQRWRGRLDLAREWGEQDLASEAEGILRGYIAEAKPLQEDLQSVRRQRDKLKAAAQRGRSGGSPSQSSPSSAAESSRAAELDGRFRKMEQDRELDDLKDRLRRDFGDD